MLDGTRDSLEQVLHEAKEAGTYVLLDFYATWCKPCDRMKLVIDELVVENPDIRFVGVDVDNNPMVAQEYRIQSMPTLVLIENGEELSRWEGGQDKADVNNWIVRTTSNQTLDQRMDSVRFGA